MLRQAILSKLPLVTATTRDVINFPDVVKFVTGKSLLRWDGDTPLKDTYNFAYANELKPQIWKEVYQRFMKNKACLVVVNPDKSIPEAFDAGELVVPKALIRKDLIQTFSSNDPATQETIDFVDSLMPALGGLTIKEVVEVIKLTTIDHPHLTAQAITQTRRQVVPTIRGFTQIDTDQALYFPDKEWDTFITEKKSFFLDDGIDWRLVPRGALLDGPPGTGKTSGAKELARAWGVPLYRMAADYNSKWHGDSENNVAAILAQVAHEAPCVLLIDEVEKLFGGGGSHESTGVTQKVLSLLLWFMQENRSRVFLVMTSNNKKILPPELYREGRISASFTFSGLKKNPGLDMAEALLDTFKPKKDAAVYKLVKKAVTTLFYNATEKGVLTVPHSAIAEAVISVLTNSPNPGLVMED